MKKIERDRVQDEFTLLYEKYQGLVFRIAYSFVKDRFLAQDVVQEVFIKIFVHIASVDSVSNKHAWVKAIARNKAIDYCRKQARDLILTGQIERLAGSVEGDEDRHWYPAVDDILEIVDRLEPKFRQSLLLLYVHGMSYNQIAHVQNATLGVVKTRIHRAKKKLRTMTLEYGVR